VLLDPTGQYVDGDCPRDQSLTAFADGVLDGRFE